MSRSVIHTGGVISKVIKIDFTNVDGDVVRAGTPIAADGTIQNNDKAIGILLVDVIRRRPLGSVCIGGYLDMDVIRECTGMELTDECKSAMPNIWFDDCGCRGSSGGGVTSWNDLEDKPFGETRRYVQYQIPTNTFWFNGGYPAWEGIVNASGELLVQNGYGIRVNAGDYQEGTMQEISLSFGSVFGFGNRHIVDETEDNNGLNYYIFVLGEEIHVVYNDGEYNEPLHDFEIEIETDVVDTIDPKYLPSGTGGDSGVLNVYLKTKMITSQYQFISGECNVSFSELVEAWGKKHIAGLIIIEDYGYGYDEETGEEIGLVLNRYQTHTIEYIVKQEDSFSFTANGRSDLSYILSFDDTVSFVSPE